MIGALELLESVGLASDGLALLGRPIAARGPGVYLVELQAPSASAPLDLQRIGKWIERVPGLLLDGERPTSRAVRARLASFWIPSATVLFIGTAERTIAGRVAALDQHILGDPKPHAAAQWLKTLDVATLRIRWAETKAIEEYEDALLEAFAAAVPDEERRSLPDGDVVLPFANLRRPTGERKPTGISGVTLPVEAPAVQPARRVVDLPPGDADGTNPEPHGGGRTRRTNPKPPVPRTARPARRGAVPRTAARPGPEPVVLTSEGLARAQDELDELVRLRRPEVIARIRAARELGDLRENADYTAAREEQSFLEGRIQALEARLRTAVVTDDSPATTTDGQRVRLGSTVEVDVDGEAARFTIVGRTDSRPAEGRISDASPVGRALLGRSVGDTAVVPTPAGDVSYRIVDVS